MIVDIILVILLLIVLILFYKKTQNNEKNNNDVQANMQKQMQEFQLEIVKELQSSTTSLNEKIDHKLDKNKEQTFKSFYELQERLLKIDAAQQKINELSSEIVSLQTLLSDKKIRGNFGEIQLNQIFYSIYGENQKDIYQEQYKLSNGNIVDFILFAPNPLGNLPIDSKFPLNSYEKMYNKDANELEKNQAIKQFKIDLKKHISDIHDKYIIEGETSNNAVMFIPAEAIFSEIHAYHYDIVDFAQKNNVWIASPTTLIPTLKTIQIMIKDIERNKYTKQIQTELVKLESEFSRYNTRWGKLIKDSESLTKDINDLNITSNKISKRFEEISNVKNLDNSEKLNELE